MLAMAFLMVSQAFQMQGAIPTQYTCEGQNTSPPISWSNLPNNAKSLALIMDDPDAADPKDPTHQSFTHWVLYNIPITSAGLEEGIEAAKLPLGTKQGKNGWDKTGYGGPCPPTGLHHYYFKLYALDTILPDLNNPTKQQLEKAMEGHILNETELIGTYQKIRSNP